MDVANLEFDEELSAFEYMMYRADMNAHSRTSLMFIETLDTVPDVARLREQIDRTTRVVPRLRQRVVAPLLPLAHPRWVVDPDFSLDYHFRRVALPSPGSFRQLLDLSEVLHATPLDLGRPLWEVTFVEGLVDGESKAGLLWKFSHAVTDGVGGMVLDHMIHQASRDADVSPMPPLPAPEDVSALELTSHALRRLPFRAVKRAVRGVGTGARLVRHGVRHPIGSIAATLKNVDELRRFASSPPAEPSPLLRRRSLNRRYEAIDFPLADIRAAAKEHACSVNDAYLAGVAGGMRLYHEAMGLPIEAMSVAMPVNARATGNQAGGNQWSAVTLRLPVEEADPAERVALVREQVLTARRESTLNPTAIVAPLVAWLPQQLLAGMTPSAMGFDIQASNVPGHASERFIAGARITRSVPIGPLPGVAMMATMVSFSGQCFVGVNYDTASFTDPELLLSCLESGFAEVLALRPGASTTKKSPAKKTAAKKAPAKKTAAKKAPATKEPAKKSAAKESAAKEPAKKSAAKESAAKESAAKKAPAKKSTATKSPATKSLATPSTATKSPATTSSATKGPATTDAADTKAAGTPTPTSTPAEATRATADESPTSKTTTPSTSTGGGTE